MGAEKTLVTESHNDSKMSKTNGDSMPLPKHSYWFDFWVFVVFDILFFFFMYFVVP